MLEEKDIQKIGEEVGKVIEQNISPMFERLDERVTILDDRLSNLEKTVANLPTKAYLDDKFADIEGVMVVRLRKEDQKMNLLISFLAEKNVLGKREIEELKKLQVFPVLPSVGE